MIHPKTKVRGEPERPTDPVRALANRLFAQHEAELMAQLQAFVQTQKERLDPPPTTPSLIVEGVVRVIEEEPSNSNGQAATKKRYLPKNQVRSKQQIEAEFRAWQAEVFET